MNRKIVSGAFAAVFILTFVSFAHAWSLDWFKDKLKGASATKLSDTQVGAGLKEALKVGIENTIKQTSAQNGYLDNSLIKILMPENMKNAEKVLRQVGLGPKIDEFVLSMNRAAEAAAPVASDILAGAVTDLSIDDAQKILKGGNTAATDYFKQKTFTQLLDAFQPAVRKSMDNYAVTKKFQEITGKAQTLPFVSNFASGLDLNKYVSTKALDGLFAVLAQQEQKIRTDPAARVTDLLKQVFGK
jgi:hypothetical protein